MKNLKDFQFFKIPYHQLKTINAGDGDICDYVNRCMQTAQRDGNPWLMPVCEETLDPEHNCRNRE
ncbi:hypothetical protein U6A24_20575 [Aquimarina gracilis]|uniref:Uncharacterized protein n=1 Tax=Aquimarina gracilis TaxID=874422 RepID=A0ABU6A1E2_9FLAO|nr:hypothetical protein [Aquimarina gracilis]MEB3347885.1 hypothetical protein [Aquimarina gracilis]